VALMLSDLKQQPEQLPAPYLKGLESPADGKNIVRGLIQRGYSDTDIQKIAGGNALAFFRRVMG
jgi:microsomal dipeptidase-like Zn-dependent dipeptidase